MLNKIFLGGLLLILIMGLLGCSSETFTPTTPAISSPKPVYTPAGVKEPPQDKNWISPGRVQIGNFHEGAEATWALKIHNGGKKASTFKVSYSTPNSNEKGYLTAPKDVVQSWVLIADEDPVVQSLETLDLEITVKMPSKLTEDVTTFWCITDEGTKYLGDLRTTYFTEEFPGALQPLVNKYVDKQYRSLVTAEIASKIGRSKGELVNFFLSKGIDEDESKTLTEQTLQAVGEASNKALASVRRRLEESEDTKPLVLLETIRSGSKGHIEAKGITSSTLTRLGTQGYIVRGNLLKDKWEFWISVYDNSQEGAKVDVELASRWLVSMRL